MNVMNLLVKILGAGKVLFSPGVLIAEPAATQVAKEAWGLCRGLHFKLLNTWFLSFFVIAKNVMNSC